MMTSIKIVCLLLSIAAICQAVALAWMAETHRRDLQYVRAEMAVVRCDLARAIQASPIRKDGTVK